MTNKINGIDVSECEFYFEDNGVISPDGTPERANICTSPERSCENNDSCYCNKDCYFKQLKRLQQELDIKEKMLDKFMIGSGETLEKLQKENEELKKRQITTNGFICDCEQNEKYKQALKEIREMLKKSMSLKSNAYNHFINVEKAIDKIDEVLNENSQDN